MTDRKSLDDGGRAARRPLKLVATALVAMVISVVALGSIASAHVVTSITADCYRVTAYFNDFPSAGVMVDIAAGVNGQTVNDDVLVTSATTEAQVDIAAVTASLAETPAHIDIDVTWTYLGPQHAHESFTLVCGSVTTTSVAQTVATTTAAPTTTTQASVTTTGPPSTTTTQVHGTTIVATTAAPASTTTETISRLGTTVAATTTTAPTIATLPRTGSNSAFPLMFGFCSLIAGALLLVRRRDVFGRTSEDWVQ